MADLLHTIEDHVLAITFNRIEKHNAFDEYFLHDLQAILSDAEDNPSVRVITLQANGKHFSAGADLNWMQRMANFTEEENIADAQLLAKVMHSLYTHSKPVISIVQGSAFGGGAGLIAASDVAICSHNAKFCFSEIKLGLIPAVISPYVIQAIGARQARALFLSAEVFNAQRALELGLIHFAVSEEELAQFSAAFVQRLTQMPPQALSDCKSLINLVSHQSIDQQLMNKTATLIAKKRMSSEGKKGIGAFLRKETPIW